MRQLVIEQNITQRIPSTERYLKEIGRIDLIPAKREVQLARRIQNGDHAALSQLVTANLRFVVSVAKQYQNRGLALSDLINEGNLGLIKAAKKFGPSGGFKFVSFAVWWIRQHILLALAEQCRVVRIPVNRVNAVMKVASAAEKLQQKLNRKPTISEISCEMNLKKEDVLQALKHAKRYTSLDAPMGEDSEDSRNLYHLIAQNDYNTDQPIHTENLKNEVRRILLALTAREKEVIILYFGLGSCESLTLEQIGEKLNVTRERVRQIKVKALKKIKNAPENAQLSDMLHA